MSSAVWFSFYGSKGKQFHLIYTVRAYLPIQRRRPTTNSLDKAFLSRGLKAFVCLFHTQHDTLGRSRSPTMLSIPLVYIFRTSDRPTAHARRLSRALAHNACIHLVYKVYVLRSCTLGLMRMRLISNPRVRTYVYT